MPPKVKYTREQITDAAYEIVRSKGESALTARSLAAELGISTAPIFTAFENIEELQGTVARKAADLYNSYIEKGLDYTPPFKGTGLMYIKFAKDEPELFKMLFMRGDDGEEPSHYLPSGDENEPLIRQAIENTHSFEEEKTKRLYNHLSIYAHGIAVLFAQGRCIFTDEDVSRMLTEVFLALAKGERLL